MTNFNLTTIASVINAYAGAAIKTEAAAKKLETAAQTRDKQVINFADAVRGMGFTSCDAFRSNKAGKGEHHDAVLETVAVAMLNKAELVAFHSDQAAFKLGGKDGKTRIYSAKHNAATKVKNMLKRLLDAAEPFVTGERDAKKEAAAPKGAKVNTKKDLDVYIAETMAAVLKRILTDAKAVTPTGKNHEELRKLIKAASADTAKLLK